MLNFLKPFFRKMLIRNNGFVLHEFKTLTKEVLLTFDDGPYDVLDLYSILDLLDKGNHKAIFFLNGIDIVDLGPPGIEVCSEILKRGHTLGSHCYRHLYYNNSISLFETDYTKQDILFSKIFMQNKIKGAQLYYPVRMPYLNFFPYAEYFLKLAGKKFIMGGVPVGDWIETTPPDNIASTAISKLSPGTIYVFHNRPNTKRWLPIFLHALHNAGYVTANPSEVLNNYQAEY